MIRDLIEYFKKKYWTYRHIKEFERWQKAHPGCFMATPGVMHINYVKWGKDVLTINKAAKNISKILKESKNPCIIFGYKND